MDELFFLVRYQSVRGLLDSVVEKCVAWNGLAGRPGLLRGCRIVRVRKGHDQLLVEGFLEITCRGVPGFLSDDGERGKVERTSNAGGQCKSVLRLRGKPLDFSRHEVDDVVSHRRPDDGLDSECPSAEVV